MGRVPSEGGNSEIGVIVTDVDAQKAVEDQLGENPDETVRENKSTGNADSSGAVSEESVSNIRKSPKAGTAALPGSEDANNRDNSQTKKKPSAHNEPFEPWERELMEALLNDVKGHLGMIFCGQLNLMMTELFSRISNPLSRRGGHSEQFHIRCGSVSFSLIVFSL